MLIDELQRYMRVAGYSPRTIEAYVRCVQEIDNNDLMKYLDKKARAGKSAYTLNQYHAAYKLYTTKVLRETTTLPFTYTKRHEKLPVVLSKEEITQLIEATKNSKHRLMIALAYGSGLRVGEVVALKVKDVSLDELCVWVRGGKGDKDRVSILPEKLCPDLRVLMMAKSGNDYLFESERGGRLTTRTAQAVFAKSLKRIGVNKPATFHSLRHSFATHLLENGVDSRYIQKLLGHSRIQTTMIYTKVTNPALMKIRSPL